VSDETQEWQWSATNWSVDGRLPWGAPYSTKDEARSAAQSYYDDAKRTGRKVLCNEGKLVAVTLASRTDRTEYFLNP
jgi:hypothetical protein